MTFLPFPDVSDVLVAAVGYCGENRDRYEKYLVMAHSVYPKACIFIYVYVSNTVSIQ